MCDATAAETSNLAWLTEQTRRFLAGCRVQANDGTWLYTPDGKGNYRALWTRDFAYMVENAGDLMPREEVEAGLRYLIKGIRADCATRGSTRPFNCRARSLKFRLARLTRGNWSG